MTAYLDYNASTPMATEVKKILIDSLDIFANPSSLHKPGREARLFIDETREIIKNFLNCKNKEQIIFTATASEANNLIIKGSIEKYINKGQTPHIITSTIEHPSILNAIEHIKKSRAEISLVPPDKYGIIDPEKIRNEIKENTVLISICLANNEIGTIQNIKEISLLAKQHKVLLHSDAVQGIGKIDIDIEELNIDFMSFSAHKIYGPKGLGFLYVKKIKTLKPLIYGGSHERNIRAGTENIHSIIALGKCIELVKDNMIKENNKIKKLRDRLERKIKEDVYPNGVVNGDKKQRLPNTLNISFYPIEASAIMLKLDLYGISVSTGSACSSKSAEPSYVIRELGKSKEIASSSIRFSLGWYTTEEEIDYTVKSLRKIINELKQIG